MRRTRPRRSAARPTFRGEPRDIGRVPPGQLSRPCPCLCPSCACPRPRRGRPFPRRRHPPRGSCPSCPSGVSWASWVLRLLRLPAALVFDRGWAGYDLRRRLGRWGRRRRRRGAGGDGCGSGAAAGWGRGEGWRGAGCGVATGGVLTTTRLTTTRGFGGGAFRVTGARSSAGDTRTTGSCFGRAISGGRTGGIDSWCATTRPGTFRSPASAVPSRRPVKT